MCSVAKKIGFESDSVDIGTIKGFFLLFFRARRTWRGHGILAFLKYKAEPRKIRIT